MTSPPRLVERAARRLEAPLLIGRTGAGFVMLAAPGVVGELWLGSRSRRSQRLVRLVGLRDLLLSVGQVRAAPADEQRWRRAAAAADVADAAIALNRAMVHRRAAIATIAVPALGSALLTFLTSRAEARRET